MKENESYHNLICKLGKLSMIGRIVLPFKSISVSVDVDEKNDIIEFQ